MNDSTQNDPAQTADAAAPQPQAGAPEPPAAQDAVAPGETVDAGAELGLLRAELAAVKDRLLRTLAEMENLRRRTEREVADAKLYGVTGFARETLALADNLRRALDNFPAEARDGLAPHVASLLEGVELTERDFLSRLSRFGVKKMELVGGRFDPNQHEALFEVPDETQPAGTIAQVLEPGYVIGERVLRPAKVGVTRGGPKA